MTTVSDNELLLYHFGDELSGERRRQIAERLEQDVALSQRYAALLATLHAADLDVAPEPDPGFDQRLWQRLQTQMRETETPRGLPATALAHGRRAQRSRRPRWLAMAGAAMAASLLLAVGFFAGRHASVTEPPVDYAEAELQLSSGRIYQATLARHLGATRRALLTATKLESGTLVEGNADLARSLLANHRLYMAAAEHKGDRRLLHVLQEIEPVLIELANPAPGKDIQSRKGLREFVENEDLIFQVRAVEAGLSARGTTRT